MGMANRRGRKICVCESIHKHGSDQAMFIAESKGIKEEEIKSQNVCVSVCVCRGTLSLYARVCGNNMTYKLGRKKKKKRNQQKGDTVHVHTSHTYTHFLSCPNLPLFLLSLSQNILIRSFIEKQDCLPFLLSNFWCMYMYVATDHLFFFLPASGDSKSSGTILACLYIYIQQVEYIVM